jgi:hypothetical protein
MMAEIEEPQFTSLAARIAALKQSQERDSNGASTNGQRYPASKLAADTQRPQYDFRSKTINNPPIPTFGSSITKLANNQPASVKSNGILPPPLVDRDNLKPPPLLPNRTKAPPPLPQRQSSQQLSPSLPPRKSSGPIVLRKGSDDSLVSQHSAISSTSITHSIGSSTSSVGTCTGRKLPPPLEQAILPRLPPTKRELEEQARQEKQERAPIVSIKSSPAVLQIEWKKLAAIAEPPRLPLRPNKPTQAAEPTPAVPVVRRLMPDVPPPMPRRPSPTQQSPAAVDEPPPIPHASRPSQQQLEARKPQPEVSPMNSCLICRDFSRPDKLAAQYPRQSNPGISTEYLARVLCGHFDSPTDKARAIFTWLHHNIDYDCEAFFGKTVKHCTPENTLARGLAVCGGYAGLFVAIALKAGLECVMVTGHGKGYGYAQPKEGSPIPPPDPSGHAWNAVRIDDGEWKLIDPCWGAGHVDKQRYVRKFAPSHFTSSNEDFGLRHFPADDAYFLRRDGRTLSWEEYIVGPDRHEKLQLYGVVEEYGINQTSFIPPQKAIKVNAAGTTRFQFSKMCLHWDHVKNGGGLPYCMILKINGLDGLEEDFVPFEYDGTYWWVDVVTKRLGTALQKVHVYSVTSVSGKDVRGMSKREYLSRKGREGMGFQSVATWDLV